MTQITLDRVAAVDDLADLGDLGFGEIAHARAEIDACLLEDLARGRRTDTEDVAQRDVDALLARDVDARDPSHSLLPLPLLVLRLGADHEDLPLAPDDLALVAALLD